MNSELGAAIRARLVEARKRARLSQDQAGQRLTPPVSRQAISKWELGGGAPNPRELAELCTIYGVSSDWVLKGIASKPDTGSLFLDKLLSTDPVVPSDKGGHKDFQDSNK